ncbi:MAG: DUF1805 domain-containing protein [Victivallaceae bacterium]|nr:DUF1805 domain-containing protein [Victivallaceae bacterium]
MEHLSIGGVEFEANTVPMPGASLLVIRGGRGALACGYVNLATAERLGGALAIVTGVKDYADMLSAGVKDCSAAAKKLGVVPGMPGKEALLLMK